MEVARYAPGTPSWVDLGSPDQAASAQFYSELFGWRCEGQGPDAGGYEMFYLGDKTVAGLGPQLQPEIPPFWSTYITVTNADLVTDAVGKAGGMIFVPPMDIFDSGRMAVFADTTGAPFSIWEPKGHIGSELVNEPGAPAWTELVTRHTADARAFYSTIFGWQAVDSAASPGYTEWTLNGKTVAGMMEMDERFGPSVPSHWTVYFSVADTDAAAARVAELGGSVHVPPTDIAPGRFSMVADPQGVRFSLIQISA